MREIAKRGAYEIYIPPFASQRDSAPGFFCVR
jgi:hypothetical protein